MTVRPIKYWAGTCVSGTLVFVTCQYDTQNEGDDELSRQFFFEVGQGWGRWGDTPAILASIANHDIGEDGYEVVALSEEGYVGFPDDDYLKFEKIPGAGVHMDDSMNWGYLERLRYLHGTLYAVGSSGQVYRRIGDDRWEHMDDGLLQTPITHDRNSRDIINLNDIGGLTADDLYACGDYGYLYHWDGSRWTRIGLPEGVSHLQEICVISEHEIYICGYNGCLLRGNVKDGFRDVSPADLNVAFLSVHCFGDVLFLAAADGLHTYDGKSIQRYDTGLKPALQDAHQLDSADGVLWSFGYKDLAYFDGKIWTRVDHPDNPPIR